MKSRVVLAILALLLAAGSAGCALSPNINVAYNVAYLWTREFMGFPVEPPLEKPKLDNPARYIGDGKCVFCHAANYYVIELTTKHVLAFELLVERKESKNKECLPCHTVGYDKKRENNGFDDSHDSRELQGVQCENCHGPGSNHVRGLKRVKIYLSEETCKCHTGSHHPTVDEWRSSKHANSMNDLKQSSQAAPECLKCMSTEGVIGRKVNLKNAVYAITCVACHNPHKNVNSVQLRMTPQDLCISCHTAGELKVGQPVHHPQKEMMAATGGLGGVVSARGHNTGIRQGCVECHYYTRPFKSESEPAITGHDFKAHVETCSSCHPNGNDLKVSTQAAIKSALDRLKSQLDAIDGTKLEGAQKRFYDEAKFNYEFVANDRSLGVHNKVYAESLIKVAQERLGQVQK